MRLGLIADTHGCLHPSVPGLLAGVDLILHAGDIGSSAVLEELAKVAPVQAVASNMDRPPLSAMQPPWRVVKAEETTIVLVHRPPSLPWLWELAKQEGLDEIGVVVHGHTHCRRCEKRHGILFVNPGAAGGQGSASSVAVLTIKQGEAPRVEFYELEP
ncbi:MAG: YfcE family phosphodiesterase [bacterium]|jgi:putative phosphoesterase|nr:YfcE family phosphodiesterase [candidate division KSB1 bacterium]MDH7559471.1 YfcE family phosphodiesterase [bacterium]